jgi:serine/threonine protein kinase
MTQLGHYQIIRELGRGGMGVVYLAEDKRINRQVALKELILDPNLTETDKEEIVLRFKREAEASGRLSHQNIVTLFDVGVEENRHFIAMEYLEGRPLNDVLKEKGRLSVTETLNIIKPLCQALDYAHQKSIVHRDLKPDNVMLLNDGNIKLTDFGIARVGTAPSVTQTGSMLGTLAYISPEQLQDSKNVDGRSDIFSLGAMMYEMLTGKVPFEASSVGSTILKILMEEPVRPTALNPEIPLPIEAIILKCMKKSPAERYQHAITITEDIDSYQQNIAGGAAAAATNTNLASKAETVACPQCGNNIPANSKFCPVCGKLIPTRVSTSNVPVPNVPQGSKIHHPEASDLKVYNVNIKMAFGHHGNERGKFVHPKNIAISKGFIYVADTENNRIQIFDPFGNWFFAFDTSKVNPPLQEPSSIVASENYIYALGSSPIPMLYMFDNRGNVIKVVAGNAHPIVNFKTATSLAISAKGNIFLTDSESSKVMMFDSNLNYLKHFNLKGPAGENISPKVIAVDKHENMYILDYSQTKVYVYNIVGVMTTSFGKRGAAHGEMSLPKGIAVDSNNNIYVADTFNNRIQIFNSKGDFLYTTGARGNAPGQFSSPEGIAISPTDELLICDKNNNRIQILQFTWRA